MRLLEVLKGVPATNPRARAEALIDALSTAEGDTDDDEVRVNCRAIMTVVEELMPRERQPSSPVHVQERALGALTRHMDAVGCALRGDFDGIADEDRTEIVMGVIELKALYDELFESFEQMGSLPQGAAPDVESFVARSGLSYVLGSAVVSIMKFHSTGDKDELSQALSYLRKAGAR